MSSNPAPDPASIPLHLRYPHYYRRCPYEFIDVYRVLDLFSVHDAALSHAIKKLLVAGQRGDKVAMGQTQEKDVSEAIVTLTRWLEMRKEEAREEQRQKEIAELAEAMQPGHRISIIEKQAGLDYASVRTANAAAVRGAGA